MVLSPPPPPPPPPPPLPPLLPPDHFGRVIVNIISVLTFLVSSAVVIPTTLCVNSLTKHRGSARKGNWRGRWRLLCLLFSISVAACLLSRSGDVESNPGPGRCECSYHRSYGEIINSFFLLHACVQLIWFLTTY